MSANQMPRRVLSIKPCMELVDSGAVIEFTSPKAIIAKDVAPEEIPKRYRLPTMKRVLHIDLYLPGLKPIPDEWQRSKSLKWPMRLFSCSAVADSRNHPRLGSSFNKLTTTHRSKYITTELATCPHDKWCRANPRQQPRNGELWYRMTAHRVQISILLELKTGLMVHQENTPTESPRLSTESLLTSSESSAASVTSINRCPHYYYWDSGKLTHPIDFQASRLIVTNGKITCYFAISETNKRLPVWTKEELDHLENVSLNLELMDGKMRKMVARRSTTHIYKTVPPVLDPSLVPPCNLFVSANEADVMYYQVTLNRKPGQSLGLTLVERPLPSSCASVDSYTSQSTGLFIKCVTSGGLAEQSNKLKVGDQILAINSVSVLVSSSLAGSKKNANHSRGMMNSVDPLVDNSKCDNPQSKTFLPDNAFSTQVDATNTRSTEFLNNPLAAGFTAYPFAMRLLRQAIGPVHLYVKRVEPTRIYVYPSETETTTDKLATLVCPQPESTTEFSDQNIKDRTLENLPLHEEVVEQEKHQGESTPQVHSEQCTEVFERAISYEVTEETTHLGKSEAQPSVICVSSPDDEKSSHKRDNSVIPLFGTQSEDNPVKPNTLKREPNASEEDLTKNDMADVDIQHSQLIVQTDGMLANWFQWTDCKQGEKLMNTGKAMQTLKDPRKPPAHDNRKQAFQRTHASSSVVVKGSIHREHKHKYRRGDRSKSYNQTVLAKSSPRIVSGDAELRQRLRNELKTTNLLEQRTQRIHGTTRIRTASIARRGYEGLGLQKQNEPRDRDNFAGNLPTKQPGASQGSNRLGQSKLQERLNALEEYFSKNMPPVSLSPHSPADMNEVKAFHAILKNLTDEEWELLLRVVMQPDDLIQEQLVLKVVSDSPSSKPIPDAQPPLTDKFVSATKRQKTSTFPQYNPRTVVNVSGSLPAGTKSRICVNSGLSSGDVCHRNRIRLREKVL